MMASITRTAAPLVFICVFAACGPARKSNYYSISKDGSRSERYSRINQYTAFGKNALGAQKRIADAYEAAQHQEPPTLDVEIYNASFPKGVSLDGGLIEIAEGAPYEAIGKFEFAYWLDSAPREAEIEDDVRRLAMVAKGNVMVIEVTRFAHADDRVNFVSGVILNKTDAPADGHPPSSEPPKESAVSWPE